jgi:hypothetical protein
METDFCVIKTKNYREKRKLIPKALICKKKEITSESFFQENKKPELKKN